MDKATPTLSPASVDSVMALAQHYAVALLDLDRNEGASPKRTFNAAMDALRAEVERLAAQAAPTGVDTRKVFPVWEAGASPFKQWCHQYFGHDADELYLAEAVMCLPRANPEPMKDADKFELHRLLAEERYTVRQLSRELSKHVDGPTFMGEPLVVAALPATPPKD